MKNIISVIFFLFSLMLSGVFLSSWSYIRKGCFKSPETKFWIYSIVFSICSLFFFGIGTSVAAEDSVKSNSVIFSFANGAYVASVVFQTLFCVSLRKNVSKNTVVILTLGLALFTVYLEYLRSQGNFAERVLEIASIVLIFLCIQLYQLIKILIKQFSIQLEFLFVFTFIELILVVFRLIFSALVAKPILTYEAIPFRMLVVFWFNLGFNMLSYLTMLGFWVELSTTQQVATKLENERISLLLQEREQLISSLLTANKTAATGALSASLAHELNQPIGASQINLFTLKKILSTKGIDEVDAFEIIERIEKDNHRAGDIVNALRSVFTQEGDNDHQASIANVMKSVINLVQGECISLGIELKTEIEDMHVLANRVELQQVFLNLINNAIDALSGFTNINKKIIWISAYKTEKTAQVLIGDNGPGVPEELVPKLFDLFETRKDDGMGIGLWLSKYIVERNKGTILYSPRREGGSQFTINIPLKGDVML